LATTGYMLLAIQLEERDLIRSYGSRYEAYRKDVSMLVPRLPKKKEGGSLAIARKGSEE